MSSVASKNNRHFLLGTAIPLLLIAVPFFAYLSYIYTFGVALPAWDEWEFWWSMKGWDEGNW